MPYAKVISVVEHVNYVLGITFYSFLLYCLLFRTKQNLGTYRYLQIVMVTIDAAYTTVQMFINERIVTADGLFAMIPTSNYDISLELLCAYLALYNLTFVMFDYSFLYRLWAIKSPLRIRFFSHPAFITLLCAIGLLESLVWFATLYFLYVPTVGGRLRLHEYTMREFGIDTTEHVMMMGDYYLGTNWSSAPIRSESEYSIDIPTLSSLSFHCELIAENSMGQKYRNPSQEDGSLNPLPLSGMIILCSVMGICFGFLIYAFFEIFHHLREARLISKASIRLQHQLFVTLCLQTVIPLTCLYAPCGLCICLPPLRIDSLLVARAIPLLITFFLPLDTLAVIISMADYRKEVARVLQCYSTPTVSFATLDLSTAYFSQQRIQGATNQQRY